MTIESGNYRDAAVGAGLGYAGFVLCRETEGFTGKVFEKYEPLSGLSKQVTSLSEQVDLVGNELQKVIKDTQAVADHMKSLPQDVSMGSFLSGQTEAAAKQTSRVVGPMLQVTDGVQAGLSGVKTGLEIARNTGSQSATQVAGIEMGISFVESLGRKEGRPIVVNLLQGSLRGSIVGAGLAARGENTDSNAIRIATGAGVGFIAGGVAAVAGSTIGCMAKNVAEYFGCKRRAIQVGAGTAMLLASPLIGGSAIVAVTGGFVIGGGASLAISKWPSLNL